VDERNLFLEPLKPGDRVSVPRKKGGREIALFVMVVDPLPRAKDQQTLDAIVKLSSGKLKRFPYWRVRMFIDDKKRRELQEEAQHDGV
jgi:hypothetical protein